MDNANTNPGDFFSIKKNLSDEQWAFICQLLSPQEIAELEMEIRSGSAGQCVRPFLVEHMLIEKINVFQMEEIGYLKEKYFKVVSHYLLGLTAGYSTNVKFL